jgi:hypothetical protein
MRWWRSIGIALSSRVIADSVPARNRTPVARSSARSPRSSRASSAIEATITASGTTPLPEPAGRPPLSWCSMLTVRLFTSVVG